MIKRKLSTIVGRGVGLLSPFAHVGRIRSDKETYDMTQDYESRDCGITAGTTLLAMAPMDRSLLP